MPHLSDGELLRTDPKGQFIWTEKAGAVTWMDRRTNQIRGWRANGDAPPTHERSKPLSFLLSQWLYDRDVHVLHAGVSARGGHGVLVAGGSGIGKTTTVLACLLAGFDYLGDDQIAVQADPGNTPGTVIAHSLYHSARLEPRHLENFPELEPHALPSTDPLDNKSLLLLAELFPERIRASAVIRALVLPRVGAQAQTKIRPARRVEALTYMGRSSLMTPLGLGRRRSVRVLHILEHVPVYWLELGRELTTIPVALDQILHDGARADWRGGV
jgi:hypothetical protein